jgi:thiol-disulfide isomerase/thioredoxin
MCTDMAKKDLIILLLIGILITGIQAGDTVITSGQQAPTFSLPDIDQNYISLRDFCGDKLRKPWKNKTKHVVVISFFATWCKPCIAEIPHLEKIQDEFGGQPVKFFLVNVGEEREKVVSFLEKKDINLKILLDRYQKTAGKYDALTLPRLVVIDKQGIIRKEQKGFTDPEKFKSELKEIISGLLK